jgi:alkylation response protein AidB-like acyl-CoA dehydrogenase
MDLTYPPEAEAFRKEIRAWLEENLPDGWFEPGFELQGEERAEFNRAWPQKLYAGGWICASWPKEYGGKGLSVMENVVLAEEFAKAGAPLRADFFGDTLVGPTLLQWGTEEQKKEFLPQILSGQIRWCQGFSEPDSGSDLASIRTRAAKVDGGYLINGTKVWTSNAHLSDYVIALFRTQVVPDKKHEGLTQFLVDLRTTKGITVRPIVDLAGKHHFNEVNFTDAFVPDEARVGNEGDGWKQVTAELGYERSGPERYLSSIALIREVVREVAARPDERGAEAVGRMVASLATLRQMSTSVAGMLQAGENTYLEAAAVKDVGTTFEQSVPELAHALLDTEPTIDSGTDLQQVLGYITQTAPSFSLRGGTREILRGIIARGLGLR